VVTSGALESDPFGHQWGFGQHVEDVTPEEMQRRSEAWIARMSKAATGN
jgi:PhnB protein